QYDNVTIGEGALPAAAQVRAVEHIRQRDVGLKLRERADPAVYEAARQGQCYVPADVMSMPIIGGDVPKAEPTMPPDAPPPPLPGEPLPTAPAPMPPAAPGIPEGR